MSNEMSVRELPLDTNGHLVARDDKPLTVVFVADDSGERAIGGVGNCGLCDIGYFPEVVADGEVARIKEPCPYPDGLISEITLNVPSGKIIVTDDLRVAYSWYRDEQNFASYNSALGQHQVIEHMAAKGCAFGPVGNSCPSLYKTGDGTYIIANRGRDEDYNDIPFDFPAEELASICTDLWAYSIADFEDWKAKSAAWIAEGEDDEEKSARAERIEWREKNADIVDVTPGAYVFTHHTGQKDFTDEGPGPTIYAHIELVN